MADSHALCARICYGRSSSKLTDRVPIEQLLVSALDAGFDGSAILQAKERDVLLIARRSSARSICNRLRKLGYLASVIHLSNEGLLVTRP